MFPDCFHLLFTLLKKQSISTLCPILLLNTMTEVYLVLGFYIVMCSIELIIFVV